LRSYVSMRLTVGLFAFANSTLTFAHSITVSGISSGAYMAHQFHVANSSSVSGIGIVAGGPYYCAKNNSFLALYNCMETSLGNPRTTDSLMVINSLEAFGLIDPAQNLKASKVYVLSGTEDKTVSPEVSKSAVNLYQRLGADDIQYVNDLKVGHAFPTLDFGNKCSTPSESPYISNCNRDVAGEILNQLLGPLKEKRKAKLSRLFEFNQLLYASTLERVRLSMSEKGFAYIPQGCETNASECPIHVAFHGCRQTTQEIGDLFITRVGYNEWAEANGIVILYPQAVRNEFLGNPNGCWDWWGYTTPYYHTKQGLQMKLVARLVEKIKKGQLSLAPSNKNN
jgi:poly(3-hydroxybutyrate) depolymerase